MDFLTRLFETSGFPARWQCGSGWSETPWLGWLHIVSDLGVWSAYLAIPVSIGYFLFRRRDLPFRRIFLLFGAFILACGTSHLMEALIFWWPAYRLAGIIKLITAVVSWLTVVALIPVIPAALALRSPRELEREIAARRRAEIGLSRSNADLEIRIEDRTTQLAQANSKLGQERERFRMTLSCIGDAVIATDTNGCVNFLNPVAQQLTGWSEFESQGVPLSQVFQIMDERSRLPIPSPIDILSVDRSAAGMESPMILISKDGTERPIEESAASIRDAFGTIAGIVVVFRDISERRQHEKRLRENQERLEFALNAANLGQWDMNLRDYTTNRTQRHDQIFGYDHPRPDWNYSTFLSHVLPEDRDKVDSELKTAIAQGTLWDIEYRILRCDGKERWIWSKAIVQNDLNDKPERMLGIIGDQTERKRQEVALRQSESHHRVLADVSRALVTSLHRQSVLREIAELTVPILGDFCVFDLWDDDTIERVGWKHVNPATDEFLSQERVMVTDITSERHPVSMALKSGEPIFNPDVTDEWLQQIALCDEHLRFLRRLNICSLVTVPMLIGQRRFGILTYGFSESNRRHSSAEMRLAEEIGHRTALTVENSSLYNRLQENDRRKDEFLATLAHELRNPLAPIRNGLQILQLSNYEDETLRIVREMMERQIGQMVRLVDDLLDVSRISRGKIELHLQRLDVAAVIQLALETSRPLVEAAGHQLSVALPDRPLFVNGDLTRLAQVVSNLLNNAAKYTSEGGQIWLSVALGAKRVEIRVRDTGIGIPADKKSEIFEMFTQVNRGSTRSEGGLGIGLALVKRLTEMHGGSIEVQSDGPGQGSEFIVRLPPSENSIDSLEDAGTTTPAPDPLPAKIRVLVVDDNRDSAETLGSMLRLMGHEVATANDGLSALSTADQFHPDLVLLDIGMPGMTGYEVARRMRQVPELRHTMLVAQTGWGQDEDRRLSKEAGFHHHLVKPIEPQSLEALLEKLKFGWN